MTPAETKQAIALAYTRHKLIIEGAAGVALAAAIKLYQRDPSDIACILSGGNIATETLYEILMSHRDLRFLPKT